MLPKILKMVYHIVLIDSGVHFIPPSFVSLRYSADTLMLGFRLNSKPVEEVNILLVVFSFCTKQEKKNIIQISCHRKRKKKRSFKNIVIRISSNKRIKKKNVDCFFFFFITSSWTSWRLVCLIWFKYVISMRMKLNCNNLSFHCITFPLRIVKAEKTEEKKKIEKKSEKKSKKNQKKNQKKKLETKNCLIAYFDYQ